MTVASTTNGRYSEDPDRDYMIRALRGDITTDTAYQTIAYTRELWHTGRLHDNEIVAALHVGDNAHLDDPRRFAPLQHTWDSGFETGDFEYSPGTSQAFIERTQAPDFATGYQPPPEDDGYQPEWDLDAPPDPRQIFIDWDEFWTEDPNDEEWLVDQVFAKGRGHALYAQAKQGKSLFVLHAAAQLAVTNPAVDVMYLDYEMTRSDVRDRLEDMGYGPSDDLTRLHYALLPSIPPLDTLEGANALLELVTNIQRPDTDLLTVVDTTGRAVRGEENSNDTIREFYRWTGSALKRHQVTWVRLDHAGKDATRGQRGGSAKNDDVDIVWKLIAGDNGALTLHREAARMSWVPDKVVFTRRDGPLRYTPGPEMWPAGTKALADQLDALKVPVEWGRNKVREAMKAAGIEARNDAVSFALKYRRRAVPSFLGTGFPADPGTVPGTGT